MLLNEIYNEDCLATMMRMSDNGEKVNAVITSPPYNMTKRKGGYADTGRYDCYVDWKSEEEYLDWTLRIFNRFNTILENDGVVLYNFSYSVENPSLPYKLVSALERQGLFTLVDTIIWKKKCGLPFPANKRRLSRIFEYVFVFVKRQSVDTFVTNRQVKSVGSNGQKYYETYYNYIEAANNDGKCKLNQATFSTDLVKQLIDIYVPTNSIVYDPFMGTGTTAVACKEKGINYIGSEISEAQCQYAEERLNKTNR